MSNLPKIYGFCDSGCKWEVPHRSELGSKIVTINGIDLKFFIGTQAEYNALTDEEKENVLAVITDDTTVSDINARLDDLGFKEGAITLAVTSLTPDSTTNVLKKQGNYVIGEISIVLSEEVIILTGVLLGTVPEDFRPTTTQTLRGYITYGNNLKDLALVNVYPTGEIMVSSSTAVMNSTWKSLDLTIGYDTKA